MRGLAIALLAGLLAVSAPSAQALCAVDEEGGCSRLTHTLDLEVSEGCPADEPLCILDQDGNFTQPPNDADWDIAIHNGASSAVTFELFAIGFYDENGEPVSGDRIAAKLLATIDVPAGQSATIDGIVVPANVSKVRVQALADDERQAEQDADLMNYRIFMMEPGDGEPAGELDGEDADGEGKDAPAPGFLLLVLALGALAVAAGFRRE